MKLSVMTLPLLPMPDNPGLRQENKPKESTSLLDIYRQIRAAGGQYLDVCSMDFQFGGEAAVLEAMAENGLTCSCYLASSKRQNPPKRGRSRL